MASHVLTQYEIHLKKSEEVNWQLGSLRPFNPQSRVVWRSGARRCGRGRATAPKQRWILVCESSGSPARAFHPVRHSRARAKRRASLRANASVATALAAAVRMAVISPAWTAQTGAPVSGSNRMTGPWCDCIPRAKFSWKTLINFAPNGACAPIAPGMMPNKRPSDSGT
jgi:hypothetical protein